MRCDDNPEDGRAIRSRDTPWSQHAPAGARFVHKVPDGGVGDGVPGAAKKRADGHDVWRDLAEEKESEVERCKRGDVSSGHKSEGGDRLAVGASQASANAERRACSRPTHPGDLQEKGRQEKADDGVGRHAHKAACGRR